MSTDNRPEVDGGLSGLTDVLGALPCPFCGAVGISIKEGSTFRWEVAECDNCGAQCGEVRKGWHDALTEWNMRSPNA